MTLTKNQSASTSGNADAEIAAMIKTDGDWLAMSKDAGKFIGHTTSEFTFFPPGAPFMSDRKAITDFWDAFITTPGLEIVWAPNGAVVSESGDLGYTHGAYRLTTVDDQGLQTVANGKYLTMMRKQPNGEWRPSVDIFNADE